MEGGSLAVALGGLLWPFEPISLDELDERAALQRRVDHTYLVAWERFAELTGELPGGYRALEIEGNRAFTYDSIYFDTPDLDCYRDHVAGRRPRLKVRTRLYADTGACSFELKLKTSHGETVKEQVEHDPDDHGTLTPEAREFLERCVRKRLQRDAPQDLDPALTTTFERGTLAARDGSERVTCDVDLRLLRPDGACAQLERGWVLVETKTADGDGECDRLLRRAGLRPLALSKYRTGIAILAADDPEGPAGSAPARVFERH